MKHLTFNVTDKDFTAQVLESDLPVLVEFTADWCPPCKMLKPIMNTIAEKYDGKLRVGLLDTDVNPAIVAQYGVMGMPTLMLFVGGEVVEVMVGFRPAAQIEEKLLPHLTMESA